MIDTVNIYTAEFDLKGDHSFLSLTGTDSTGEIISSKIFCNKVPGVQLDIVDTEHAGKQLYAKASIPKLLYGTSYHEVKEGDCERAIAVMQSKLAEAGVRIPQNNLESFKTSRVDFCRNIQVDYHIIDYLLTIKELEISRRAKQQFTGETVTFYNKQQELSFYNKVKEIRDKEHAEDIQQFISDKQENILRIESRLKRAQAIERELGRKDLKFAELFDFKQSRDNILKNIDRLIRPTTQLEFDFGGDLELAKRIKQERERGSFIEFLGVVGIEQFFARCGHDWEIVRKFLLECGYKKSQTYSIVSDLKAKYQNYVIPKHSRDLLAEIKQKVSA